MLTIYVFHYVTAKTDPALAAISGHVQSWGLYIGFNYYSPLKRNEKFSWITVSSKEKIRKGLLYLFIAWNKKLFLDVTSFQEVVWKLTLEMS